jgi:hypothetical protein
LVEPAGLSKGDRVLALKQLALAEAISADELALVMTIVVKHAPSTVGQAAGIRSEKRPLVSPVALRIAENIH